MCSVRVLDASDTGAVISAGAADAVFHAVGLARDAGVEGQSRPAARAPPHAVTGCYGAATPA